MSVLRQIPMLAIASVVAIAAAGCTQVQRSPEALTDRVELDRLQVRLVTDEAEAALAILEILRSGGEPTEEDWQRLFSSEGYRRLERRELAMGRSFESDDFEQFLLSDSEVARFPELVRTLEEWKSVDVSAAARRALAYLPADAIIRATIYPVVKPLSNSFVFNVGTDSAAIFLYLDPTVSDAKFENTLAHELHHIGHAAACAGMQVAAASPSAELAVAWMGAFGEGLAMLAAAGGPEVHPHAVSDPEDRSRWDRDVGNAAEDMRRLESFFLDVIEERLADPDAVRGAAMGFFGEQGPWYTVGWLMAATVERERGRERLVEIVCEPQRFLQTYNQAAAARNRRGSDRLPLWSDALLASLPAAGDLHQP
jgi:hypothetical protein